MKKKRTGASGLFSTRPCPSYRFVRVANPSRNLDLSCSFFPFAAFLLLRIFIQSIATREKRRRRDEEDEKVEEEEEVSRPIVMHDYSLRYRGAPRGYIPRFTIFMPDSGQSGQSEFRGRARRRVVELWKAAAPCHCLKFSYPRRVGCFIQLRARTPCLSFTSGEQGYKLIGGDAVYNFFFSFPLTSTRWRKPSLSDSIFVRSSDLSIR